LKSAFAFRVWGRRKKSRVATRGMASARGNVRRVGEQINRRKIGMPHMRLDRPKGQKNGRVGHQKTWSPKQG